MKNKKELIRKANKLLTARFGIPVRAENLPDPVDLLIATILSQNTNDKNSYQAFRNLRNKYPSWNEVLNAKRSSIERLIKIAGLGHQKSAAIKNFLKQIYESRQKISLDYLKKWENEKILTELTGFKGIGVKTASCVLLFALGKNVCPVDTHVHRTVNRIGIVSAKTPDKTFSLLNENFPEKVAHSFHTNLIRLGREICQPKNPACSICPLLNACGFESKNFENKKLSNKKSFMLLDNV